MTQFRQQWTLETATTVLKHPTVDSETWAEAVEWLLLYGPPETRELLQQASSHATQESFPELQPKRYAPDGSPCYDISELAQSLGITEEKARQLLAEKEEKHGLRHGYNEEDTTGLQ